MTVSAHALSLLALLMSTCYGARAPQQKVAAHPSQQINQQLTISDVSGPCVVALEKMLVDGKDGCYFAWSSPWQLYEYDVVCRLSVKGYLANNAVLSIQRAFPPQIKCEFKHPGGVERFSGSQEQTDVNHLVNVPLPLNATCTLPPESTLWVNILPKDS